MLYRITFIVFMLAITLSTALARPAKHSAKKGDQQTERTTAADPKVVLSVCLRSGSITVRGWDRNQVRASSSDGMAIDFQKPAGSSADLPKDLTLETDNGKSSRIKGRCLSFGDLELDVPREASVNLQAGNSSIEAAGIASLRITAQSGSITVERVTESVDIKTIGGEISVANSKGAVKLHSVGGSIQVNNLSPNDTGDVFEAGTVSGDITLDQVNYAQVKINAVSGSLSFTGPLAPAGRYRFETISGDVSLSLPSKSSFRLSATLSANETFSSEFPLQPSSANDLRGERIGLRLRQISATYGNADTSITVSSFNGSIQLHKK